MYIRKFKAASIKEGLDQVRVELGSDAIILKTEKLVPAGENTSGKELVEIVAAIDPDQMPKEEPSTSTADTKKNLIGYTRTGKAFFHEIKKEDTQQPTVPLEGYYGKNLPGFESSLSGRQDLKELKNRIDVFFKEIDNKFEQKFSQHNRRIAPQLEQIHNEIMELKKVLNVNPAVSGSKVDSKSIPIGKMLARQEVEKEIVDSICRNIDPAMKKEDPATSSILSGYMQKMISKISVYSGGMEFSGSRPSIVALVGPTGVGKTTTIAKLAADVSLFAKKKVAIFTIDTFRIGAQEQLKTYTEILHLPLEIIRNSEELNEKIALHQDKDLILIDTVGRSSYDRDHIQAMINLFKKSAYPITMHLVLSASTKWTDLQDIVKNFREFSLSCLLFTKLDETTFFGNIFNLSVRTQIPLSYITNGQNVPEDIEIMSAHLMTKLLFEGRQALAKNDEKKCIAV